MKAKTRVEHSLKAPVILEASTQAGDKVKSIMVDNIPAEGATLRVSYSTMSKGHSVTAFEGTPGFTYESMKIITQEDQDKEELLFNIPKALFLHLGGGLNYQYVVRDELEQIVGISANQVYILYPPAVTWLEGPVITQAEPLEGSDIKIIMVDKLPPEGAELKAEFEGAQAGCTLTLWIQAVDPYEISKMIEPGESEYITHIPIEKLKNSSTVLSVSFGIKTASGLPQSISKSTLYFKVPGFEIVRP
jgi:hypothetical protein